MLVMLSLLVRKYSQLFISAHILKILFFIPEVFHSNSGINGIRRPIGDADYYINGGTSQPECSCELSVKLSHYQ